MESSVKLHLGQSLTADGIDGRKIYLRIVRAELDEELEDLVMGAHRIGGGLVYLVDDDDRFQPEFERFLEDETGLRHRTFLGIDDQKDCVDGTEHALNLWKPKSA